MRRLIVALCLLCSPAFAAVALVGSVSKGSCGNSAPETACTATDKVLTFAHSTGAGSNLANVLGCVVSAGSGDVMPNLTATYASVSMHEQVKRDKNWDVYLWELVNPTSGSNNFVVTAASSMTPGASVINCVGGTFSGVDQATPWTTSGCTESGSNPGTTAACTLSASGANDMVVVAECNGTSIGSPTGAITRRDFHDNTAGACNSFGLGTAAGNTTSLSWNNNGSDSWSLTGGALKEAAAGPAMSVRRPIAY